MACCVSQRFASQRRLRGGPYLAVADCVTPRSCQKSLDNSRRRARASRSVKSAMPAVPEKGVIGTSNASAPEMCRSAPLFMMNLVRRRVSGCFFSITWHSRLDLGSEVLGRDDPVDEVVAFRGRGVE